MKRKLTKDQNRMWEVLKADLNTVGTVDFKKFREQNEFLWLTLERKLYWIEDMDSSHILNCVAMLERNNQQYTKAYEGLLREIYHRTGIKMEGWKYDED